ncbi:bifunctional tetrahydrofolate synthase/dihydrofolate synthase [Hydrogenophaga sp. PAMC20947]|uniref:bifunctional tetrahydrofolate synthase/dihydrofolate synthase n=1 Tax=Hydrogenophaga sp. PAMC20947 TaxID=2565558 RepID=UPI00109D9055|nr:bifunctional tetrahydrofolate synthase/dihydrofolate synthase [Hydrogenophaga sp. PAMC20947]QCB46407.1 bifunctional tetrahydrofolate synthase/dihydrofolate synthase [Hydrogenophaga sp. PAMC20947]
MTPSTLSDWLAHCERLHPMTIDMGLDRVHRVAQRMHLVMNCPVITVAGTNGKGSTCAMLEAVYGEAGFRTGVYTSPHLVLFEERCRVAGEMVAGESLLPAFAEVEAARLGRGASGADDGAEISLTYFEFTTLAILRVLSQSQLDVAILEVGLGGRLDAVNIIDTDCAVITSIALDHTALLGLDRESIGYEKAGIMRTGRPVIVSDPVPPQSVLDRAMEVGANLWRLGKDFHFAGDQQQWGWAMHPSHGGRRYAGLAYPALRGANQLVNASGVLGALEALRPRLPVTAQAVRNGLAMVALPGRFQMVPGAPSLVLDVAHNPHSVAALTENLDAMGFFPTTHAVFGVMADKDLPLMLERIAPLIDRWYVTNLPLERASTAEALAAQLDAHPATAPQGVSRVAGCYGSPMDALRAAVAAADPADRIVVFGSFHTVGGVLQDGVPRLSAKHVSV